MSSCEHCPRGECTCGGSAMAALFALARHTKRLRAEREAWRLVALAAEFRAEDWCGELQEEARRHAAAIRERDVAVAKIEAAAGGGRATGGGMSAILEALDSVDRHILAVRDDAARAEYAELRQRLAAAEAERDELRGWHARAMVLAAERDAATRAERARVVAWLRAGAGETRAVGSAAWEDSVGALLRETADALEAEE